MHPQISRSEKSLLNNHSSLLQSSISPNNSGSVAAARMPAAAIYVQVRFLSTCFLLREYLTLKWLSKGRKHSCHHHHFYRHRMRNLSSSPPQLCFILDTLSGSNDSLCCWDTSSNSTPFTTLAPALFIFQPWELGTQDYFYLKHLCVWSAGV